jgi:hypothetical protein
MYTIIGGDGREYGPVTAAQVRAWIAGGRANLDTKVKVAGGDTWRTAADFPEFTGQGLDVPPALESDLPLRASRKLDVMGCYERSWELLKANFWPFLSIGVLMGAFYAVSISLEIAGIHFITPIIAGPFIGGIYKYMLLRIRGQPATPGALLAGFRGPFVPLVLIGIVNGILGTLLSYMAALSPVAGLVAFVPCVYLVVGYCLSYIVAVDKGTPFWASLEASRRAIRGQWWRVFFVILLGIPFALLGVAALVVGIFVTLPLILGATVYAYEDLCGQAN